MSESKRAMRQIGAMLGETVTQMLVWINGVTASEGEWIDKKWIPASLQHIEATFDVWLEDDMPIHLGAYRPQIDHSTKTPWDEEKIEKAEELEELQHALIVGNTDRRDLGREYAERMQKPIVLSPRDEEVVAQLLKKCKCDVCGAPAVWVRKTQFAGNHTFCQSHAEEEENFGQSDSPYFYWEKL